MIRSSRLGCLVLLAGCAAASPLAAFDALRQLQPVVLTGDDAPGLLGTPVGHVWAYRYDAGTGTFEQIPVQVDERALHDLTQGQTDPVYELTYDWFGVDDGLLDADDEIAFMVRDAGDRAPDTDLWVLGADDARVEVRLEDPRDGGTGFVYLYTSSTIADADPSFSYVTYTSVDPPSGVADVDTPTYSVGYESRWLLTRLEIKPGPDVLDRIKGRAFDRITGETEELWDSTSELLGARAGKVRVLRQVQGAASGALTTHVDSFYRDTWRRTLNLRVHPVSHIWYYYDYLPPVTPGRFYSSTLPAGLVVDGSPESTPDDTPPRWSQTSLPDGTLVVYTRELTPFPAPDPGSGCAPQAGSTFYWLDDSSYDDTTGVDGAAYGNHGLHMRCTGDSNRSAYSTTLRHYFLPAQDPYSSVGAPYAELEDMPLAVATELQPRSALTDARLDAMSRRNDGRLDLAWTDALGEDGYEIYRGDLLWPFAYDHDTALACGLAPGTETWTTPEDQVSAQPSYYYLVVPYRGSERRYGQDGNGGSRPPSGAPCP